MNVYFPLEQIEKLKLRAVRLTDDVSIAFANQDYTPEDCMRVLVETLALLRDTIATLRYQKAHGIL